MGASQLRTPNNNTYSAQQLSSTSSDYVQLMEINRLVHTTISLCSIVCSVKTIIAHITWVWKVIEWGLALQTFNFKWLASPLMGHHRYEECHHFWSRTIPKCLNCLKKVHQKPFRTVAIHLTITICLQFVLIACTTWFQHHECDRLSRGRAYSSVIHNVNRLRIIQWGKTWDISKETCMLVISDVFLSAYMAFHTSSKMKWCDSNGQHTPKIWIFRKFRIFYFNTASGQIDAVINWRRHKKLLLVLQHCQCIGLETSPYRGPGSEASLWKEKSLAVSDDIVLSDPSWALVWVEWLSDW